MRNLETGGKLVQRGLSSIKNINPFYVICTLVLTGLVLSLADRRVRRYCYNTFHNTWNHVARRINQTNSINPTPPPVNTQPSVLATPSKQVQQTDLKPLGRLYTSEAEALASLEKNTLYAQEKLGKEPSSFTVITLFDHDGHVQHKTDFDLGNLDIGIAYSTGRRKAPKSKEPKDPMEDRFATFLVESSKCPGKALAVFDGHSGSGAAEFACTHIKEILEKKLELYISGDRVELHHLENALKETIREIDLQYTSQPNDSSDDGTTCTLVFIPNPEAKFQLKDLKRPFLVANTGDSRAILMGPQVKRLTADASLTDKVFFKHIEKKGWKDHIQNGRLYPIPGLPIHMEVARAIGDRLVINDNNERVISCEPKITYGDLHASKLILCTDGFSKFVNTTNIAACISSLPKNNEQIAMGLVAAAYNAQSNDNITVIVAHER
jgi:serine/threonine protein phosphatase PrpC